MALFQITIEVEAADHDAARNMASRIGTVQQVLEMDEDGNIIEDGDDERMYPGEDMDGDFDSAMASAGHGTDEDYGYYGGNE